MIFTKSASSRAAEPSLLADRLARFCRDHYVTYSVDDAIIFAKRIAGKEDIILITGSLFVVADALKTKAGNSLS
jgi:folylpolyglutamate synthase/dihydropteroate synthase